MPQALVFYEDCRIVCGFGYCFGKSRAPTLKLIAVFCYGGRYDLGKSGACNNGKGSFAAERATCGGGERYSSRPLSVKGNTVATHNCRFIILGAICILPTLEAMTGSGRSSFITDCAHNSTDVYGDGANVTCNCIVRVLVQNDVCGNGSVSRGIKVNRYKLSAHVNKAGKQISISLEGIGKFVSIFINYIGKLNRSQRNHGRTEGSTNVAFVFNVAVNSESNVPLALAYGVNLTVNGYAAVLVKRLVYLYKRLRRSIITEEYRGKAHVGIYYIVISRNLRIPICENIVRIYRYGSRERGYCFSPSLTVGNLGLNATGKGAVFARDEADIVKIGSRPACIHRYTAGSHRCRRRNGNTVRVGPTVKSVAGTSGCL